MMDEETVKTIGNEEAEAPVAGNERLENYMKITAIATSIIVLSIACLLLYCIRSIVLMFALAFLASYILSPAVRFFERRRINRVLIVSVLYVVFVAAVVASIVLLLPLLWGELKDIQTSIQSSLSDPEFGKNISTRLEAIQARLVKTFPVLEGVDIAAQFDIDKGVSGAASWILDYIGQFVRALTAYSGRLIWMIIVIILIPFITFFLLKDGGVMKRSAMKIIPSKYSETTLELLQKIDRQIGRYIRGRIAESLILSALTIIGLRILSIKYYLVIGGIAGFANLIPYIGPVGIAIPAIVVAGYQYGMFHMVITGIFLGSLQVIDNAILVPLVVGKSVDLHPVTTIFVIFVGAQLLGFLGMIIAVPVTSIFIATFQALYKELRNSSPA
jgi:predicted PurR-regulated permease PerM